MSTELGRGSASLHAPSSFTQPWSSRSGGAPCATNRTGMRALLFSMRTQVGSDGGPPLPRSREQRRSTDGTMQRGERFTEEGSVALVVGVARQVGRVVDA